MRKTSKLSQTSPTGERTGQTHPIFTALQEYKGSDGHPGISGLGHYKPPGTRFPYQAAEVRTHVMYLCTPMYPYVPQTSSAPIWPRSPGTDPSQEC